FNEDRIICVHCKWAPEMFKKRDEICKRTGWYLYVTGRLLDPSESSKINDELLRNRSFNALDFKDFEVKNITIEDVSTGSGTALFLKINSLKILLDCCFNLDDEDACNLSEPPDLIFISHAHKDHYSGLKALTSIHDSIPVLMSCTTLDLIQYFIRGRKYKRLREYLMDNAYPLIFNDTYFINKNISFQILKAGHFPGAAMLNIHIPNHNLLFTGDLSLYDLQPIMGANSGIQNVTGPVHSLILDGQFCTYKLFSLKRNLDEAFQQAINTLENGSHVLVMGDAGSWLLIFYLKIFNEMKLINKRFKIYLDKHTLEIMKIIRYRFEDITDSLSQKILRLHDPFASIIRQDMSDLKNDLNKNDPSIILYNSNNYPKEINDDIPIHVKQIFENPKALLIITGPIRSPLLRQVWEEHVYQENQAERKIKCHIFKAQNSNNRCPSFILHPDENQVLEIIKHLNPRNVYLFHGRPKMLKKFISHFDKKDEKFIKNTKIHAIKPNTTLKLL
ncbi:MAG: MBL fold metallo-hydrolase, partial [Promethearchaeota archaeon]